MNIWIEYWRPKTTENKNYHAQSQPIKWEKPDKKDIRKSAKNYVNQMEKFLNDK